MLNNTLAVAMAKHFAARVEKLAARRRRARDRRGAPRAGPRPDREGTRRTRGLREGTRAGECLPRGAESERVRVRGLTGARASGPRATHTGDLPMNSNRPDTSIHRSPRGWHSRGYLPHFDAGSDYTQSVTIRLADSVPKHVLQGWNEELCNRPESERELELNRLIEAFLDTGWGACHLRDPRIDGLVEGALLHFDGDRYTMHAWVVMPNHVHALFTPAANWSLSSILWSWKSFTSKEANKLLGRTGQFWQEDYFDRYIRNDGHFHDAVTYIEFNPVSAGLCALPEEWQFGSARLRL